MHDFPPNNIAFNQLLPTFRDEKLFCEISISRFFFSKYKQRKEIYTQKALHRNWSGQLRNANNMVTLNIVVEILQSLDSIIIPLQLPPPAAAAAAVYIVSDDFGYCGGRGLSSSPRDGNLRHSCC